MLIFDDVSEYGYVRTRINIDIQTDFAWIHDGKYNTLTRAT